MRKSQPEHQQTKESPTVSTEDHLRFQGLDAQAGPFLGMGWLQWGANGPTTEMFLSTEPSDFSDYF